MKSTSRPQPFSRASAVVLLTLAWLLPAGASWGQETASPERFADQERVTAIDLVVAAQGITGATPAQLRPEELTVLEEGVSRPVVGVAPLGTGAGEEPWRLAIYFDLALCSTDTVSAAAQTLAAQAAELSRLGSVEIWIADPQPRSALAATRDAEAIAGVLSRIFVEQRGDDRLVAERVAVLAAARKGSAGKEDALAAGEIQALATRAAAAESLTVRRRLDALVTWLAADPGAGPRALFWVQGGYDLDPGLFYGRRLSGVETVGPGPRPLAEATEAAAAAIGALGWVVAPVSYDSPETATWLDDGEYERFRRRRNEDSNLRDESVALTIPVGKLLRRDKDQAKEGGPLLLAPSDPLKLMTRATAGELIETAEELPRRLNRLGDRFRVTYQVSRPPDGRLRAVTLTSERAGLTLAAPRQVRSSTPEAVARARARRILDGEADSGELVVDARYRLAGDPSAEGESTSGRDGLTARVRLAERRPTSPDLGHVPVRLTVAFADRPPGEGGTTTFHHELLTDQDWTGAQWSRELAIEPPADALWAVVMVEDLSTGEWGSWEVEVAPPAEEDDES